MAILKALKVTDISALRKDAKDFDRHAADIKKETSDMLKLIDDTKSVWDGKSHNKYHKQFNGLRNDMDKLYKLCHEYSTDLEQIASNYQKSEDENTATASKLKSDIVMK